MKDLIKKSEIDLIKELNEKRLALRDLRFGIAGSKNKNVKQQITYRKEIARIQTVLKQNKQKNGK
jgi:ribosomal protein L29